MEIYNTYGTLSKMELHFEVEGYVHKFEELENGKVKRTDNFSVEPLTYYNNWEEAKEFIDSCKEQYLAEKRTDLERDVDNFYKWINKKAEGK